MSSLMTPTQTLFRGAKGYTLDNLRNDLIGTVASIGLNITMEIAFTNGVFLNVTLELGSGAYRPYCKPNERLMYINTVCPPFIMFNTLMKVVSKRVANISSNQEIFDVAAPYYNEALYDSGFRDCFFYFPGPNIPRRKRHRNINCSIPFRYSRKNICRKDIPLIDRHFIVSHRYARIFLSHNLTVSVSCVPNIKSILVSIS